MNIKHHPDEATIMAYAAGSLEEAHAVLVSCHLEVCAHCRSLLQSAEALGGAILCEEIDDSVPDEGSFGRLLEKISASEQIADDSSVDDAHITPAGNKRGGWQQMPAALRNYLDGDLDTVKWKRIGPGVWQRPILLSEGAKSSLRLLRISPGHSVPEHGHCGQETTLILKGAYDDEIGHFAPGDVADLDEEIEHQPVVSSDVDCICLAATEAPTRFKGIIGKLMQPFIGI